MKLFGHPVHTMLIHFPTALLPMDLVLGILYFFTGNESFGAAGFYCLAGGVLSGFAALVTGVIDWVAIPKVQKEAVGNGLVHGFTNAVVMVVYTILAVKAAQAYPQINEPSLTFLVIKNILILTLLTGNYLGGKLIYQYHVGIHTKTS